MGALQSSLHSSFFGNFSLSISIMVSLHFLISTLELLHLKAIYKPNAANASAYQFSLLETCFILNVQNFSSILWANVLYDVKLGSFKEKLPLAWHLPMLPKLQKHSQHSK